MKISRARLKEIVKEVMTEESEYQQFFQNALDKVGKSIPDMGEEEKKAFFDKIDAAWQGKGEKSESVNEASSVAYVGSASDITPLDTSVGKIVAASKLGWKDGYYALAYGLVSAHGEDKAKQMILKWEREYKKNGY